MELSVFRLRTLAFQTMISERHLRREISLKEALVEMYQKLKGIKDAAHPPLVPYLGTGGMVMKVRVAGKYEDVSLLVAIGPAPEG